MPIPRPTIMPTNTNRPTNSFDKSPVPTNQPQALQPPLKYSVVKMVVHKRNPRTNLLLRALVGLHSAEPHVITRQLRAPTLSIRVVAPPQRPYPPTIIDWPQNPPLHHFDTCGMLGIIIERLQQVPTAI